LSIWVAVAALQHWQGMLMARGTIPKFIEVPARTTLLLSSSSDIDIAEEAARGGGARVMHSSQFANMQAELPVEPGAAAAKEGGRGEIEQELSSEEESPEAGSTMESNAMMLGQMTQSQQSQQQAAPPYASMMQQYHHYQPQQHHLAAGGMGMTQQWELYTNPTGNPALRRDAYLAKSRELQQGLVGVATMPPPAPYVGGTHELALPPLDPNRNESDDSDDSSVKIRKKPAKKKKKKATTKKTKDTSKNEAGKGTAYTKDELVTLAELMEEILPIGKISFQRIADRYNEAFPTRTRTLDNLRRKYQTMVNNKTPTGNPDMPEHIQIAKRAHYKTIEKANSSHALSSDEEEDEENEDDAEEEAEDEEQEAAAEEEEEEALTTAASTGGSAGTKKKNPPKTPSSNRKKGRRGGSRSGSTTASSRGGGSSTDQLMDIMLLNQEDCRMIEEERAQKEERAARRSQEMWMQMFSTAVGALTAAFSGGAATAMPAVATHRLEDSSDEDGNNSDTTDTLSSVQSMDSAPHKRSKLRQLARRKRRAARELTKASGNKKKRSNH